MAKKSGLKPGETAPESGQYKIVGPRGGNHGEVTSIKGKTLPPTPEENQTYKLVDKTKGRK